MAKNTQEEMDEVEGSIEEQFTKVVSKKTKAPKIKVAKEEPNDSDYEPIEEKEAKKSKEEIKIEKITKAKERENELMSKLKKQVDYKELLSDAYTEYDNHLEMVILGDAFGLICEGTPGCGKSFRAIAKCTEKSMDWCYLDGTTTPQGLYVYLYENRDKDIIILDDTANLMENKVTQSILKGALWQSVGSERLVSYNTTKPINDSMGDVVDNKFVLNARLIILTNELNKENLHVQAIMSRVNCCRLDLNRPELLKILRQIAQLKYEGLNLQERIEIFDFLEKNTSASTSNLNIRSLLKMFQFKVYSNRLKNDKLWQTLSLKMLKRDDTLLIVEEILKDTNLKTGEEREAKFKELTGKERATFYRLKKRIDIQNKEKVAV